MIEVQTVRMLLELHRVHAQTGGSSGGSQQKDRRKTKIGQRGTMIIIIKSLSLTSHFDTADANAVSCCGIATISSVNLDCRAT